MSDAANGIILPQAWCWKSLHSWDSNRKRITEGLNALHTYAHSGIWKPSWGSQNEWTRLTDWDSPLVSWKKRRSRLTECNSRGPSFFPSRLAIERLWLVDEDYRLITNTAERKREREREKEGERDECRAEPAVCLLLSHDASTHVRISLTEGCFYGYPCPGLY